MFADKTVRRAFIRQWGGAAVGGGVLGPWLDKLAPVSASESTLPPGSVQFSSEIEPLVRMLEETPRDRVIEKVAARVSADRVSYQQLLSALFLAGVRNIQPRPSVGFKFHAVLVVHSAHLAALASVDSERWLPIFWAIDNFKSSQARDEREGNWTMAAVTEADLPDPVQALRQFDKAMQQWDESAVDLATAAMARGQSAGSVFNAFARYAARDFRSIGHKVIYLANAYRCLETIGWQHAQPVLRSLAYAMLNHQGDPNPATSDLDADRDGRMNAERVTQLRTDWIVGRDDPTATAELLRALRTVDSEQASQLTVEMLNRGVSVRSIYDALFAAAAEMTMRQPAIVPLHALTTTNAIHYVFRTCSDDRTRRFLLLQNAAFIPRFAVAAASRGKLADLQIDQLQAAEGTAQASPEAIFHQLAEQPADAAAAVMGYLAAGKPVADLMHHARRLIFRKGNDSHDYKYSSAVLEDFFAVTPAWRDRFLAAAMYKLRHEGHSDTSLVHRIETALS